MSLREGLANLRAARSGEQEPQQEAPPSTPAPATAAPSKPEHHDPAPEKRETFSTRIRPSVRYALKRQLLDMQERGEKVRMEDVLEALILRYVEDEAFRKEVGEKLRP